MELFRSISSAAVSAANWAAASPLIKNVESAIGRLPASSKIWAFQVVPGVAMASLAFVSFKRAKQAFSEDRRIKALSLGAVGVASTVAAGCFALQALDRAFSTPHLKKTTTVKYAFLSKGMASSPGAKDQKGVSEEQQTVSRLVHGVSVEYRVEPSNYGCAFSRTGPKTCEGVVEKDACLEEAQKLENFLLKAAAGERQLLEGMRPLLETNLEIVNELNKIFPRPPALPATATPDPSDDYVIKEIVIETTGSPGPCATTHDEIGDLNYEKEQSLYVVEGTELVPDDPSHYIMSKRTAKVYES